MLIRGCLWLASLISYITLDHIPIRARHTNRDIIIDWMHPSLHIFHRKQCCLKISCKDAAAFYTCFHRLRYNYLVITVTEHNMHYHAKPSTVYMYCVTVELHYNTVNTKFMIIQILKGGPGKALCNIYYVQFLVA